MAVSTDNAKMCVFCFIRSKICVPLYVWRLIFIASIEAIEAGFFSLTKLLGNKRYVIYLRLYGRMAVQYIHTYYQRRDTSKTSLN